MTKFLSKYLKPSQISMLYAVLALIGILSLSVFITEMNAPQKRERVEKTNVTNIITSKHTREMGLDAVADKVKEMEVKQADQEKELLRLREENKRLKKESLDSVSLARAVKQTKSELEKVNERNAELERTVEQRVNDAVDAALTKRKIDVILGGSESKNTPQPMTRPEFSQPSVNANNRTNLPVPKRKTVSIDNSSPFTYGQKEVSTVDVASSAGLAEERNEALLMLIEPEHQTVKEDKSQIYLPKGAMLTGVLITGIDAPTTSSAQEQPMPVLVRVKKEAILPNFKTLQEVRECFALMAGYGDLGSERAHFRGESITCVKDDGTVIEESFSSYAVGEDGKAGIKGILVTRNSTVLANTMMAGFASGLASAFNVTPVPVIATESTGTQQYQDVFSPSAVQGGAARGASQAMDKLAEYYLKLADAIHPVIEISSGRTVDMVITEGTTL
ncbi:TrbI/VirB10 family protein [Vibrio mediterranei]|uniref:TrbI/VirB10 family protein n=1 Tax=Vibrio mediterranei TaxID=689 RepID=UPI0040681DD5